MTGAEIRRPWLRPLLAAVGVVVLTACGHVLPRGDEAQPEVVVAPPPEPTASGPQEGPSLPAVELDTDLLFDLLIGEIAIQRGELAVAADSLARAAAQTRDHRLAERATRVALQAHDYDRAFESARLWTELRPDAAAPLEAVAVVLVEQGRLEEAQSKLVTLLEQEQGDPARVYRRVADLLSRQTNQEGALQLMDRLVAVNETNAVAHYAKAYLADRLKRHDLVTASLDRALELRPDWEDAALAKLAHLIARGADTGRIIEFSGGFLDRQPKATKLRMHYARYLVDRQQTEPALAEFETVLEHDPNNADASFAAGLLAIQLERLEKAQQHLAQNLKLRPQNDQVRLYLGQVAAEQDQFAEAEKLFREIRDQNYYIEAQMQLGSVIAKRDGTAPALEHLRSLHPRNEEEYVRLVLSQEQVLREATELSEAKVVLDGAINRYPDNSELLYARGLVAAQLELLDVHESDMRKLLAKDPQNAHALNALGYTLADSTERYEEAHELIKQALAIRPEDPFILDSMGWVQYRLGNFDLAIKYLEQALAKRQDAEIAAHLGEVLWMTGDRARAESVWKAALKEHPQNDVLLRTIEKLTKSEPRTLNP